MSKVIWSGLFTKDQITRATYTYATIPWPTPRSIRAAGWEYTTPIPPHARQVNAGTLRVSVGPLTARRTRLFRLELIATGN